MLSALPEMELVDNKNSPRKRGIKDISLSGTGKESSDTLTMGNRFFYSNRRDAQ